ncbi:MAG: hypothetical protein V4683_04605 [Bacteroidota bacterium]
MSKKIKCGLAALVTMFAMFCANAQDQATKPNALLNLMRFEGQWEAPTTMVLEGKTYLFTYYLEFKKTADGSGLSMEEWFSSPELGTLKGSNLIGYNGNDEKIHWFSVDNFGTSHEHIGVWKTNDHFYMQANEKQQSKKFVENINMVFKSNDLLELTLTASLDGNEFEKVSGLFQRKK